jgi:N,N-dimethylformamidase
MSRPPQSVGYPGTWTVSPGEVVPFCISSSTPFDLSYVRLHGSATRSGDVPETVVAARGREPGGEQVITLGSHVLVPEGPWLSSASKTVTLWVQPTTRNRSGVEGLVTVGGRNAGDPGWGLGIDADSVPFAWSRERSDTTTFVRASTRLERRQWALLGVTFDESGVVLRAWSRSSYGLVHHRSSTIPSVTPTGTVVADLVLGGSPGVVGAELAGADQHCFNGKISDVRIWSGQLEETDVLERGSAPLAGVRRFRDLVVAWDFASECHGNSVRDVSTVGAHGVAVNAPSRAVTGFNWGGAEVDFRRAPDQYNALHFHDDDLHDAGWKTSCEFLVPHGTPSGVYAARLDHGLGEVEHIPFFVRNNLRQRSAVALLLPTFTYQAYGNQHFTEELCSSLTPLVGRDDPTITARDQYVLDHAVGLSVYDFHNDGSLCRYSSRRRPILEMSPAYTYWPTEAPRHFSADLQLIDWLERRRISFDVITDDDLDALGGAAVAGRRVIISGSHPEYTTDRMREAISDFVGAGGRMMYLGGNGFYWVTSTNHDRSLLEVRRGHAGTRSDDSPPGEIHHSTTGEPGGLWRFRGQAPNQLVGVGFCAQGWGPGSGYRRVPKLPETVGFVWEGIDEEIIGDGGPLGGAACDEVDSVDVELGTPSSTIVLASSRGMHLERFQLAFETSWGSHMQHDPDPRIGADLAITPAPSGGAVFAVGSIGWVVTMCSDDASSASRLTSNVLRRFSDPRAVFSDVAAAGASA